MGDQNSVSPMERAILPLALAILIGSASSLNAAVPDTNAKSVPICTLLSGGAFSLPAPEGGCRWSALPERPLLAQEAVEFSIRHTTDEAERGANLSDHWSYVERLKRSHLFTTLAEFSPCPRSTAAGRKILVHHAQFSEVFGYAECNGQVIALKVHLRKEGGTSPLAVFDDVMRRAVPVLSFEN